MEALLSLQQLRQQLLDDFQKEELEELLRSQLVEEVSKKHFVTVAKHLGIEAFQAQHVFQLIDRGDGFADLTDIMEALISKKPRLLWRDLRHCLLARFASISEAFFTTETREVCEGAETESFQAERPRDLKEAESEGKQALKAESFAFRAELEFTQFTKRIESLGIGEEDARAYFSLLLEDNEEKCGASCFSGVDGCVEKLRRLVQSAVPPTSMEDFWHRVAAEWPDVLEAARKTKMAISSQRLGDLLSELLRRQKVPDRLKSLASSSSSGFQLLSLDLEAFKAIALQIDVSQEDAQGLFYSIARSSRVPEPVEPVTPQETGIDICAQHLGEPQIYLEDFAEQLILWTESDRRRPREKVRQLVAPARAAISALKAELLPEPKEANEPKEEVKAVKDNEVKVVKLPRIPKLKKRPKLPWCTYYHLRPNPVPLALS